MTEQSQPLITIIIAVFNGAKTLQQCIDSVAQQTYSNVQLIIIDGGSNDGTVELLRANDQSISYWVSEPDTGIYNAWNKGLVQAKGDWICFLGADDYFLGVQALEMMSTHLELIPINILVVYSQIMLVNHQGDNLYSVGEPWEKIRDRFKQVMCIPHQGVMHRSNFFDHYGQFNESFRIAGDYELLMRELKNGDAIFVPNLITIGMRQGGVSSNPKNSFVAMREIRRAQCMHGQCIPGWVWGSAMMRVYLRTLLWRFFGDAFTRKILDLARKVNGLPAYWTKI